MRDRQTILKQAEASQKVGEIQNLQLEVLLDIREQQAEALAIQREALASLQSAQAGAPRATYGPMATVDVETTGIQKQGKKQKGDVADV